MDLSERIMRVIRGQDSWSCLHSLGISLQNEAFGRKWSFPDNSEETVRATVRDILDGAQRLKLDLKALGEWASFIISASSYIDLTGLEESSVGEEVLDSLWKLSFEEDSAGALNEVTRLSTFAKSAS